MIEVGKEIAKVEDNYTTADYAPESPEQVAAMEAQDYSKNEMNYLKHFYNEATSIIGSSLTSRQKQVEAVSLINRFESYAKSKGTGNLKVVSHHMNYVREEITSRKSLDPFKSLKDTLLFMSGIDVKKNSEIAGGGYEMSFGILRRRV